MAAQMIFQRYELKYMLTPQQKGRVLEAMEPHMALDRYGRSPIRNLYYDTESFRLIRRSLEKPLYKEKLRLRSYRPAGPEDFVFVELKKKYRSVVYKRRMLLPLGQAEDFLRGESGAVLPTQIGAEIGYFRDYYPGLGPAMALSYQREAYYDREGGDFRVTFDEEILARRELLSLGGPLFGAPLLEEGRTLMEIKTSGGIPLWLVRVLTREGIYRTSFSKYGAAYQKLVFHSEKGDRRYA